MNRFRALFLVALFALAVVAPQVQAASLPLLDPDWRIVPDPSTLDSTCNSGDPLAFGAVMQLIQNLMNGAVSLTVLIAVLVIVYAGVLFMLAPSNAENINKAKGALTNAIIGLVIVLASWLVIDSLMKVFYVGQTGNDANFLPWNEIFTGGPACVKPVATKPLFSTTDLIQIPGVTGETGTGAGGTGVVRAAGGVGACSASTLQSAATAAGVSLTQSQAQTFACIARYESSCGAVVKNYNWGKGSSAAGPFQVLLDTHADCYENTACRSAAGVSGALNCGAGFTGGNVSNATIANRCLRAASNLTCSIAAAHCVYQKQGFSAWTADKNSRGQASCIQ